MKVNTTRFGKIEVDDSSIIRMPKGPIGFEDQTDYVMVQQNLKTSFRWLQSMDDASLAFVVVDPSEFFNDYEVDICDADAAKIHLASEEDALVITIVTFSCKGKEITTNLAAPIIINSKELIGMQIVLQDNRYCVKHSLVKRVEQSSQEKVALKAA